jgi:hypothetical protein
MRAEFFHADDPDHVVATALWDGRSVSMDGAGDPDATSPVERIFRPTPVVVDDPSMRPVGSSGPVVLEPGDLRWFMAAARTRGAAEGLGVRLVVDQLQGMGWDPAGAYRPFLKVVAPATPVAPAAPSD